MLVSEPAYLIERARYRVMEALQRWKVVDVKRATETRGLLEQSVADLLMAIDLLRDETEVKASDLNPEVEGLRRDVSSMIRLVDDSRASDCGIRRTSLRNRRRKRRTICLSRA